MRTKCVPVNGSCAAPRYLEVDSRAASTTFPSRWELADPVADALCRGPRDATVARRGEPPSTAVRDRGEQPNNGGKAYQAQYFSPAFQRVTAGAVNSDPGSGPKLPKRGTQNVPASVT